VSTQPTTVLLGDKYIKHLRGFSKISVQISGVSYQLKTLRKI
jgi:hypothetical protein